jgi:hypothetical protein
MSRCILLNAVCLLLVLAPPWSAARAEWNTDGVSVCSALEYQSVQDMVPDGAGGAFLVWHDLRSGAGDIYAQRLDAMGDPLWAEDGVGVCTETGSQWYPRAVSDGEGGFIVTWSDYRGADYDIYAQRIDAEGAALWAAQGVAVSAETDHQQGSVIAGAAGGGAVIAWPDARNGQWDIYAQKLDADGNALWTANGLAVCLAGGDQTSPRILPDSSGGAFLTWTDGRYADDDIYMQWILWNGSNGMSLYGRPVCSEAGDQQNSRLAYVGSGLVIVVWDDGRNVVYDVYAQKVSHGGTIYWAADGVAICAETGDQMAGDIVANGDGGAIIVWTDVRGATQDIYAQRVDANGNGLWDSGGQPVCTATDAQMIPRLASDGDRGAYVAWTDGRTGGDELDIYIQLVDEFGASRWASDGIPVTSASRDQSNPRIVPQDDGGVIVAWTDARLAIEDIYAQRINADGSWGFPYPAIHSVLDVPGDEGGCVNLTWDASARDPLGEITEYTLWRALEAPAAKAMLRADARLLELTGAPVSRSPSPVLRRETKDGAEFYWELIASHDAYHLETYASVLPTVFDCTDTCEEYHFFQVIAHTAEPLTFYVSAPDSGCSVDNLSPCPPTGLAGAQSYQPEGLSLTWNPNTEPDLGAYRVYRGIGPDFDIGPGSLIAAPCDTLLFDDGWDPQTGYCYKVGAVDIHGNEGPVALLCAEEVTGLEPTGTPARPFLAQNRPNPFNPRTEIAVGLAERSRIRLRVFDAAGRHVRTLVDGDRAAGRHALDWDGRDERGHDVPSGVYLYRLEVAGVLETRRMVLLR